MESWHPILVHFPLVLLPVSTLFDAIGFLGGQARWHRMAYAFLLATLGGALGAVLSGNSAAAPYWSVEEVRPLIELHEDMATATLVAVLACVFGRLPLHLQQRWRGWPLKFWFGVGLVAVVLLWVTGHWGGELVYGHGVGVRSLVPLPAGQ